LLYREAAALGHSDPQGVGTLGATIEKAHYLSKQLERAVSTAQAEMSKRRGYSNLIAGECIPFLTSKPLDWAVDF